MSEYEDKYDRRLLARLREVEAENAELRKDRERLEWVINNCARVRDWPEGDDTTMYYVCNYRGKMLGKYHDDWRDAIDEGIETDNG